MFYYDKEATKQNKLIYHNLFNKTFTEEKASHEWFFINYLLKSEMKEDREVAEMFVMFVSSFYPDYKWFYFDSEDMLGSVALECAYHDMNFWKVFRKVSSEELTRRSMIFGDIVTEFLIRVRGYSLVGCCNQKNIITSQSDCDKRFEELLEQGFSLHRMAKLVYERTPQKVREFYPFVKGTFKRLPVLPTKDTYVPFEEFIEDEKGNVRKVLQFQPIKM